MKSILILLLLLVSANFIFAEEVTVDFNGYKYRREIPTYDEGMYGLIKDMESLMNEFSRVVMLMNSGVDSIQFAVKEDTATINKYLDSIKTLTCKSDSLLNVIATRDSLYKLQLDKETENLKKQIEDLKRPRTIINFGITGGYQYSAGTTADNSIYAGPMLQLGKCLMSGTIGYGVETKQPLVGLNVGWLFRK